MIDTGFWRLGTWPCARHVARVLLAGWCAALVLSPLSSANANTEVEVYNHADVDAVDFPVSAVIPLPYGVHQNVDNLRLVDSAGSDLAAQMLVEKRWTAKDNSVRELRAVFKATLPAGGQTTVRMQSGNSALPENPVTVTDGANSIVASNGVLSITIAKDQYNFLDEVRVNGKLVIDNGADDGGYFINRFGTKVLDSAPCTNLAPRVFAVEQSGPEMAVIRVEWPTYIVRDEDDSCFEDYPAAKDPVPGGVVWFTVRSNSTELQVDHLTLNNGITAYRDGEAGDGMRGWPFLYEEAGIKLQLAMPEPTVSIGYDDSVHSTRGSMNAIQDQADHFAVAGGPEGRVGGFAQVAGLDGLGFTIFYPFLAESFPTGWAFDADENEFTFVLAPDGCAMCEAVVVANASDVGQPLGSGKYVIEDMSSQPTSFVMRFHDAPLASENAADLQQLHRQGVSAVVAAEAHQEHGVSGDLFGLFPALETTQEPNVTHGRDDYAHKATFGLDMGRARPCAGGYLSYSAYDHMVQRPPPSQRDDRRRLYAEIKRPQ